MKKQAALLSRMSRMGHLIEIQRSGIEDKYLSSHFPALFRAVAASLGTLAAMVVVRGVFFALGAAGIANLGAQPANLLNELRATRLQAGTQGAEIRAVATELGAERHLFSYFDVFGGTVLASGEASQTGGDAIFVLVMHDHVVWCNWRDYQFY